MEITIIPVWDVMLTLMRKNMREVSSCVEGLLTVQDGR